MQRQRKKDRGREGGRKEERSEAGSQALVNNPPLYVISKRRCRFRTAIGQPNSSEAKGEGRQSGEKIIYVPGRELNTEEEGASGCLFPSLVFTILID